MAIFALFARPFASRSRAAQYTKKLYTTENGQFTTDAYYEYILGQPKNIEQKQKELGSLLICGVERINGKDVPSAKLSRVISDS